jgi:probable addiction module antidote protein
LEKARGDRAQGDPLAADRSADNIPTDYNLATVRSRRHSAGRGSYEPAGNEDVGVNLLARSQQPFEEAPDDPALIVAALGDIARARGIVQLAKDTGLTREGLYKALSKDGNPSLGTVLKVLKALGLKFTPQVA